MVIGDWAARWVLSDPTPEESDPDLKATGCESMRKETLSILDELDQRSFNFCGSGFSQATVDLLGEISDRHSECPGLESPIR